MTTPEHDYTGWLERYRIAWIERDADAAGRLFTEDAIYREQPFQEPFVGRQGIRDYWTRVTASQTQVELRFGRPLWTARVWQWSGGRTWRPPAGPSRWRASSCCCLPTPGNAASCASTWLLTQARVEPPPGWGE